jgi:hypothetical protein
LKLSEIEDNGSVKIVFYENGEKSDKRKKKVVEKEFEYGQAGKYYEYILFFDKVEGLEAGKYRYAIFCKGRLVYESQLEIKTAESKKNEF